MNHTRIFKILTAFFAAVFCFGPVGLVNTAMAGPAGTAFTYQGRLMDGESWADGLYEFEFKLFDLASGGTQVNGTYSLRSVEVADGYFTVQLDFGGVAFDGDARWLEIGVRPVDTTDPFTTLSPRQEVTPSPYALYAEKAGADNDWQTSGDDMYSIPSGNVGIGTSSPLSRLSAGGNGFVNTGVYGNGSDYGVYGNSSTYGVFGRGSYSGVHGRDDDSGSFGRLGHNTYGVYGSGTVYGGYFLGEGYFSGNVGIGTTSPEAKLGIASPSSGAALGVGRASGQPSIKARSDADGGWLIMDSTGSGKAGVNYYHNADVILAKGGGNVGIGTSNIPAGVSLAVDGKILCEEVEVQLSEDWPDYVFEQNYELMPLEKLGQYVREKKHLPDMTTADEVGSSGISLGQVQTQMLRKIEELTLYVVDLNQQLSNVRQENKSLQNRITALERKEK
jgi:hypothetical protein